MSPCSPLKMKNLATHKRVIFCPMLGSPTKRLRSWCTIKRTTTIIITTVWCRDLHKTQSRRCSHRLTPVRLASSTNQLDARLSLHNKAMTTTIELLVSKLLITTMIEIKETFSCKGLLTRNPTSKTSPKKWLTSCCQIKVDSSNTQALLEATIFLHKH